MCVRHWLACIFSFKPHNHLKGGRHIIIVPIYGYEHGVLGMGNWLNASQLTGRDTCLLSPASNHSVSLPLSWETEAVQGPTSQSGWQVNHILFLSSKSLQSSLCFCPVNPLYLLKNTSEVHYKHRPCVKIRGQTRSGPEFHLWVDTLQSMTASIEPEMIQKWDSEGAEVWSQAWPLELGLWEFVENLGNA